MARPGKLNFHGRKLIRELKRLREAAGLNQEHAGERLHMTVQKISRVENGQIPGYHETLALLGLYGVTGDELDTCLSLWERAKKRAWWAQIPDLRDIDYLAMEQESVTLTEFQLGWLPELLQTERYARERLLHVIPEYDAEEIDTGVSVLTRRQERLLTDDNPLTLHALIHQPVLSQGIDREQMTWLVEHAEMPNIDVRIVPQSGNGGGLHHGLDGSVMLFGFDDPEEPDIAFTKTVLGWTQSQDAFWTTPVRAVLDHLTDLAHSREESLHMLKSMVSEMEV